MQSCLFACMCVCICMYLCSTLCQSHARIRIANGPISMTQHHAADLRRCSTLRKAIQDQQSALWHHMLQPEYRHEDLNRLFLQKLLLSYFMKIPLPAKPGPLAESRSCCNIPNLTVQQPDAHLFRYYTFDRSLCH